MTTIAGSKPDLEKLWLEASGAYHVGRVTKLEGKDQLAEQ